MPTSALHVITASALLDKDAALGTLPEPLLISELLELLIDLGSALPQDPTVECLIFLASLPSMILGLTFQAIVLLALVAGEV